jgi:hypothetical protein
MSSGAGMVGAKANMPRGLLSQIQLENEKAAEKATDKKTTTANQDQDGPVKKMSKEEEVGSCMGS